MVVIIASTGLHQHGNYPNLLRIATTIAVGANLGIHPTIFTHRNYGKSSALSSSNRIAGLKARLGSRAVSVFLYKVCISRAASPYTSAGSLSIIPSSDIRKRGENININA